MRVLRELTVELKGGLGGRGIGVSVHVYHEDVFNYSKAYENGEVDPVKRERIINKYVGRFTPLIQTVVNSPKGGEIRVFNEVDKIIDILNPELYESVVSAQGRTPRPLMDDEKAALRKAHAVIQGMISIQNEVWERIKPQLNISGDKTKEGTLNIDESWSIIWIGQAARLLKRLNVPEDIIALIQEFSAQKRNLYDSPITPQIEVDGTMHLVFSEDPQRVFRTVGEIFTDPKSKEFKLFLKFLSAAARAKDDPRTDIYGLSLEDSGFKAEVLAGLKAFLRGKNIDPGNNIGIDDFNVYSKAYVNYVECLTALYLPPEVTAQLLAYPRSSDVGLSDSEDREAEELHNKLKDIPFNAYEAQEFLIIFKDSSKVGNLASLLERGVILNKYKFMYRFVPGELE